MSAHKTQALAAVALGASLSLACSLAARLPFRSTPIPGPGSVIPPTSVVTAAVTPFVPSPTAPPPTNGAGGATPSVTPPASTPVATIPTAPAAGDALLHLSSGAPVTVTYISMLDIDTGWGVGQGADDPNDHILRTTDGGATWQDVTPPEPDEPAQGGHAAAAFFQDANTGWVAYYEREAASQPSTARVWHTRNAGQTWVASQPLNVSEVGYYAPSDIVFVDHLNGWLMAHVGAGMNHDYVLIFRTRDGGQTWERLVDPNTNNFRQSCGKTGLGFLNAQTGWVTGDCQGVAPGVYLQRTDDGGVTWREQPLPPPPGAADLFQRQTVACGSYALTPLPPQTVLLAVTCLNLEDSQMVHYLYASSDGGQTWQVRLAPGRELAFLNASTGWALEEGDVNDPRAIRGLHQTQDGGQNWEEITTVAWAAQFDFVTERVGWAVAQAGEAIALVRSGDGGISWRLLEPVIEP